MRTYEFPNATIKVYRDRTCQEFPKWCMSIHVERPRAYVAAALRQLRQCRRNMRYQRAAIEAGAEIITGLGQYKAGKGEHVTAWHDTDFGAYREFCQIAGIEVPAIG